MVDLSTRLFAPPALVLAVHGTRSAEGTAVNHALRDTVAAALPGVRVELGWVDLHTPPLVDTLRELGPAVVVPVFLAPGYHVRHDIPAAITAAGGRAMVTELVGPCLVPALVGRLAETDGPADAVVLAAAGSRWPKAVAAVERAAAELQALIRRPVVAGFVTAAQPSVTDAVARLRGQGHDHVTIASWLLAPGEFARRLLDAGADAVTAPLGIHPILIETILTLYREAETPTLDQGQKIGWIGSPEPARTREEAIR